MTRPTTGDLVVHNGKVDTIIGSTNDIYLLKGGEWVNRCDLKETDLISEEKNSVLYLGDIVMIEGLWYKIYEYEEKIYVKKLIQTVL